MNELLGKIDREISEQFSVRYDAVRSTYKRNTL